VLQSADALIFIADSAPGEEAVLKVWREKKALLLTVVPDRFDALPAPKIEPELATPLGLVVRPLFPQEQLVLRIDGGLLVQRINAAAARAGVKVGDVIMAVNGRTVSTIQGLADEVGVADGAAALLIQRDAARLFIPIETQKQATREPE